MTPAVRLGLLALLLWAAACSASPAGPAAAPTPLPLPEQGRALFRNKGCVTCHRHTGVPGDTGLLAVGPDLSAYRNEAAFLRQWLADPRAIRPDTPMPDMDLSEAEIDALIAFLNAEG